MSRPLCAFPDTASARAFAGAVTEKGFREEAIIDHGDEVRMQFWREDAPHGIDRVTDMIDSAITGAVER